MTTNEDLWSAWNREAASSAARLGAAGLELTERFAILKRHSVREAERVSDASARRELQTPRLDLAALATRLGKDGPESLSRRELKNLISVPGYLSKGTLLATFKLHPSLMHDAVRTCLVHWPRYVSETWGAEYEASAVGFGEIPQRVVRGHELNLAALLARSQTTGADYIASRLPTSSLSDAYEFLRARVGVRDTWLFASSVLATWIFRRSLESSKASIDDDIASILRDERLRALLLPPLRDAKSPPPVRSHTATQALVVATALAFGFTTAPRAQKPTLTALTTHLLSSTFLDPRDALRSEGWLEVARVNPHGFQQLLSSLCEQDLDLFFKHAMNEPDRRKFWLRYLASLERTACVLDRGLCQSLHDKLQGTPEAQGVLDRAYAFRGTSNVQAFILVFASIVVVEFSDNGNAAYIYTRDFFTKEIEPLLRSGKIDNFNGLKSPRRKDRITHRGSWQSRAADLLATEGVHPRTRQDRVYPA